MITWDLPTLVYQISTYPNTHIKLVVNKLLPKNIFVNSYYSRVHAGLTLENIYRYIIQLTKT